MGHRIVGAYHVGRVLSPCVQNVKLPPDNYYPWTCKKYKPSEELPYPIMGHVWNTEVYDENKEEDEGKAEDEGDESSEKLSYPIMGHAWNAEVYDKYMEENEGYELDYAQDFHPHVPIIELNGFSSCDEDLGGPIINTSGEIVGMFAGDGTKCIGIHVTALKEVLKRYAGNSFLLYHSYNLYHISFR